MVDEVNVNSELSIYDFEAKRLLGKLEKLRAYEGHVILIVNTASKCGFTSQYAGLELLHQEYKAQGFSVLGFPCNQFGSQEPGTEEEIQSFCQLNYGVSFPMYEKVNVNGAQTHPLFVHLKKAAPGLLGTEGIKWNFTKFLVDRKGVVVERFGPQAQPHGLKIQIELLLNSSQPSAEDKYE